ncbi:MAG: MATE family efflux transporter [Clostridiales bacterium]|nr:MATE family efflux transporter [Clostridiales bacterium]
MKIRKRREPNMLEGPLFSNIVSYTIPIILTGFLQLLFNAADLVVVGQFCGDISVAAVGNTGAITALIVNLFIGLSVGTGVCVAQALGSNDTEGVHRAIHTAIPTALVGSVFITFIGIFFSEKFLMMMDTPESVLPLSAKYMKIYFAGTVFMLIYNFCASILRAAGDTKSPLIYLVISGVINVVLNVIFVTVFHMNVAGVALATTISQGVSAVLVVIALMRRDDACKLFPSLIRFYKKPFMQMIRIGLPAGIQSSLFSISNVIIQSSVNSFGDVLMSGNAAANNIEGFIFVILNAFHQTALNFIGQNVGAKQYKRVKKICYTCLASVFSVSLVVGGIILLLGKPLLSIYIPDAPEAIQWGLVRMSYMCIPYCLCGLMDTSTGALRGMGVSVAPMIISILGVCGIRIVWIYTIFQIPQYHTPQCLYLSYAISWAVTFMVQFAAFTAVYRKRVKESAKSLNVT